MLHLSLIKGKLRTEISSNTSVINTVNLQISFFFTVSGYNGIQMRVDGKMEGLDCGGGGGGGIQQMASCCLAGTESWKRRG